VSYQPPPRRPGIGVGCLLAILPGLLVAAFIIMVLLVETIGPWINAHAGVGP
jgi:hypothetical protein